MKSNRIDDHKPKLSPDRYIQFHPDYVHREERIQSRQLEKERRDFIVCILIMVGILSVMTGIALAILPDYFEAKEYLNKLESIESEAIESPLKGIRP